MDYKEIKQVVDEVVASVLKKHGVTIQMITEEKSLVDDLMADSLDLIEIMLSFEDRFEISIDEDRVKNIATMGDIYQFILAEGVLPKSIETQARAK
ncbi:MAG: acyl carrier protein [Spirochaetes bacterium]|nr:acyl carrier protein [Spirochaetota bacterium]